MITSGMCDEFTTGIPTYKYVIVLKNTMIKTLITYLNSTYLQCFSTDSLKVLFSLVGVIGKFLNSIIFINFEFI